MINHIITYTGKVFDLLEPKPEQVCIEDIAHSLAYQCRYTGHTRKFYSVAQHCVLMAETPDLPGDPLAKLLHDADETYIGDIARPWKALLLVEVPQKEPARSKSRFPSIGNPEPVRRFEQKIQAVIGEALGTDLTYSAEVKKADIRMMATEVRDLMPPGFSSEMWGIDISNPVKETIVPWSPVHAEELFLLVYSKCLVERARV